MKTITILFIILSIFMLNCGAGDAATNPEEIRYGRTKLKIQNVSEFDITGLYIHNKPDNYQQTANILVDRNLELFPRETGVIEFDECDYTNYIYVTFTRKRSDTDDTVIAVTTTQPLRLNEHSGLSTLSLLEDDFYFKRTTNGDTTLTCFIK